MSRERDAEQDFRKRYEEDHTHPANRALHLVGVPIIALGVALVFFFPVVGLSLIAFGYALNFVGHAIEGKPPSLFRDPRNIWMGAKHFGEELASMVAPRAR